MKSLLDANCRQELEARLERIRTDTPRLWGKMTAPQMICHVNDAFLGIMGDKAMEIPRGFSFWRLTKWIALYAPMQWPKGIPTRPEFDQLKGSGTLPAQFEGDKQALLASLARFVSQPPAFTFRPHPFFGKMSDGQWMRWGYLHVDHHLRQFGN